MSFNIYVTFLLNYSLSLTFKSPDGDQVSRLLLTFSTVLPLYRTGISLLSRERFLYI